MEKSAASASRSRDKGTQITVRPIFSKLTVFSTLLVIRLLAARYATIPDCDEVFNYWEPTHYLSHNNGLQTWEYSPAYAIRSWAYVGLHAILSRWISILPQLTKIHEFYGLRCIFAAVCALCETTLYSSLSINVGRRIGMFYLIATMTAAGMFHAATAFLPSTFAMYTTMLGMAAFIDRPRAGGLRTVEGIFWFAVGGILGWPFSMAMALPFVIKHLLQIIGTFGFRKTFGIFVKGALVALTVLASVTAIDTMAYKRLEFVPLNIVLYNVFGGSGKGPDIYGTEPWWFYLANLALNFNVHLLLALMSAPVLFLFSLFPIPTSNSNNKQYQPPTTTLITLLIPFYLWLGVFTLQAHKEERFMFVAYPALCVSSAIAFHLTLSIWGTISTAISSKMKLPFQYTALSLINWGVLFVPMAAGLILSLSRIVAILTNYSAPMSMYGPQYLPENAIGNICFGKEWYRFPSSYFLPDGVRPKFLKSAFAGLLPGQFLEGTPGTLERPGIWVIPEGMNDENKEDMSKYVDISACDYLVDSYLPSSSSHPSAEEPNYMLDDSAWERIHCEKFLDAAGTLLFLDRAFWIPGMTRRKTWGGYCLLKRQQEPDNILVMLEKDSWPDDERILKDEL
ncbi:Alg9-like mannosyltransferase family-domain-containing protein [Kalaharituber pfeilii]|nr:Alg9-like mannosyltransferase family-domain-containing protein [Kalaharituber pfeilii]